MAHVAKYTRAQVGHLLNHYNREPGDGVARSNQDIDPELTHLNAQLMKHTRTPAEYLQLHPEVRCQDRADVKVMCDWVVTIPQDLWKEHPEKLSDFFVESTRFLIERYGQHKNVLSAAVHMDETTPHLHFAFVPVTEDRRRGGLKVSAKEVLTRADLRSFHGDLQNYLEKTLGVPVPILNGATREGNRSIEDLKRGTAVQKVRELQEQAEQAQRAVSKAKRELTQLTNADEARKAVETVTRKAEQLAVSVPSGSGGKRRPIKINRETSLLGRTRLTVTEEEAGRVRAMERDLAQYDQANTYRQELHDLSEQATSAYVAAYNTSSGQEARMARQEAKSARSEADSLQREVRTLRADKRALQGEKKALQEKQDRMEAFMERYSIGDQSLLEVFEMEERARSSREWDLDR